MRGGYQRASRLATTLAEIQVEAIAARTERSRRRRDAALDEIARLAHAAARLVEG